MTPGTPYRLPAISADSAKAPYLKGMKRNNLSHDQGGVDLGSSGKLRAQASQSLMNAGHSSKEVRRVLTRWWAVVARYPRLLVLRRGSRLIPADQVGECVRIRLVCGRARSPRVQQGQASVVLA